VKWIVAAGIVWLAVKIWLIWPRGKPKDG